MPASLAVCVINFQGRDVLQDTLAAVCAQQPRPDEIVLIDNASTDGGLELVRNRFPEVRIIRLPQNQVRARRARRGCARSVRIW